MSFVILYFVIVSSQSQYLCVGLGSVTNQIFGIDSTAHLSCGDHGAGTQRLPGGWTTGSGNIRVGSKPQGQGTPGTLRRNRQRNRTWSCSLTVENLWFSVLHLNNLLIFRALNPWPPSSSSWEFWPCAAAAGRPLPLPHLTDGLTHIYNENVGGELVLGGQ